MLLDEELKKQEQKNKKLDDVLDFLLEIMSNDTNTEFMRSIHNFNKINKKIFDKHTENKLSQEQIKNLTSVYKQMKDILEDILNK